jgi:hypothetical protein
MSVHCTNIPLNLVCHGVLLELSPQLVEGRARRGARPLRELFFLFLFIYLFIFFYFFNKNSFVQPVQGRARPCARPLREMRERGLGGGGEEGGREAGRVS